MVDLRRTPHPPGPDGSPHRNSSIVRAPGRPATGAWSGGWPGAWPGSWVAESRGWGQHGEEKCWARWWRTLQVLSSVPRSRWSYDRARTLRTSVVIRDSLSSQSRHSLFTVLSQFWHLSSQSRHFLDSCRHSLVTVSSQSRHSLSSQSLDTVSSQSLVTVSSQSRYSLVTVSRQYTDKNLNRNRNFEYQLQKFLIDYQHELKCNKSDYHIWKNSYSRGFTWTLQSTTCLITLITLY